MLARPAKSGRRALWGRNQVSRVAQDSKRENGKNVNKASVEQDVGKTRNDVCRRVICSPKVVRLFVTSAEHGVTGSA